MKLIDAVCDWLVILGTPFAMFAILTATEQDLSKLVTLSLIFLLSICAQAIADRCRAESGSTPSGSEG